MANSVEAKIRAKQKALIEARAKKLIARVRKSKRRLELIMVTQHGVCFLCEEKRCLERAHIIPLHLWDDVPDNIDIPEPFLRAIWLCPTHHRCYDKYRLSREETVRIRGLIKGECVYAFEALVTCTHATTETDRKIIDRFTESAWKWWRHYIWQS